MSWISGLTQTETDPNCVIPVLLSRLECRETDTALVVEMPGTGGPCPGADFGDSDWFAPPPTPTHTLRSEVHL